MLDTARRRLRRRDERAVERAESIPDAWIASGRGISVTNFPTLDGRRVCVAITAGDHSVTLTVGGSVGRVRFALPAFVDSIASTTKGTVSESTGTIVLRPGERTTTVHLRG